MKFSKLRGTKSTTALHHKIWTLSAEANGVDDFALADKNLVEQVLAGDETGFEMIFDRHKRLVARVAARFFRQPQEIEEIVQITFMKFYFEIKNFRAERDFSLPSFLARIATNACLDGLRSQKRKPEIFFSELTDEENSNLTGLLHRDDRAERDLINHDLAEKLLSRLASEDRAILEMIDAEEMTVAEVSQITGWSNSKIKVKAYRARRALRKILKRFM
jgi:RNA polymerase sigma-70 factor, ECF subfamily